MVISVGTEFDEVTNMRKTILCTKYLVYILVVLVLLVGGLLYFKPFQLSRHINENSKISMIVEELGVKDGQPYINTESYNDITDEQIKNVIGLFQKYSYRRTIHTAFSDGTIGGNRLVHIFISENDKSSEAISISISGSISVNGKTYKLPNAPEFIQEFFEIIS